MLPEDLQQKINNLSKLEFRLLLANFAGQLRTAATYPENVEAIREEVDRQALYILDNLTHWRGAEATDVRNKLKEFTK